MRKFARILFIVFAVALSGVATAEMPEIPRGKGEYCVEPSDVMRKNHMSFLLHQRDDTVLSGVRNQKHSLVGCIDCHVQTNQQGEFIPVDAPAQFCEVCHSFASVKLDCFECHATTPDAEQTAVHPGRATPDNGAVSLEQELKRYIAHSRLDRSPGSDQ